MAVGEGAVLDWRPLSPSIVHFASLPLRATFPVQVYGLKRIPKDRGAFFVGNHQLYGFDTLLILDVLYQATGFCPRLLYDRLFHIFPILKHVLMLFGGAVTTPANCRELMAAKQPILFYPGGVDEVFKKPNTPKYALLWDGRNGFAKMAMESRYHIVPFAAVGLEEGFDTWFSVSLDPILRLFGEKEQNVTLPIPKFWRVRPRKMYLAFGEAVDPAAYGGDPGDADASARLRDEVQRRVREMARDMRLRAAREPRLLARVRSAASRAIIRVGDRVGLNGTRLAELMGLWRAMPEIHVMGDE